MHRIVFRILTTALIYTAVCATCAAEQTGITAELHPWGRFEPGSWKMVRVVTETLDDKGQVVSTTTTDTKTTLMDIEDDGITLEVRVCMEVAGKIFQAEPQTVKQGFSGEPAASESTQKILEKTALIAVEDRNIDCKIQQIEIAAPNEKTLVNIYYSTDVAPFVIKRVSVVRDAESTKELSTTTYELIALNMPVRLQGKTLSGAYVKNVHKNGNSTTTTLSVLLPEVPGGVFRHSSKEVDKNGRVVQRSTLELVDYGVEPEKDRAEVFKSKRAARRAAKSVSRRGK